MQMLLLSTNEGIIFHFSPIQQVHLPYCFIKQSPTAHLVPLVVFSTQQSELVDIALPFIASSHTRETWVMVQADVTTSAHDHVWGGRLNSTTLP